MAIQNLVVDNYFSTPTNTDYYTQWAGSVSDVRTLLATTGTDMFSGFTDTSGNDQTVEFFNNGLLKITVTARRVGGHYELRNYSIANLQTGRSIGVTDYNYGYSMYICLGYDDDAKKAYFFTVGRFYYNGAWEQKNYGTLGDNAQAQLELYQAVSGSALPLYSWSSVPRITGKEGKVYRLTDILNINDGNAVNDVSAKNNVDFSKKTKVNTLINDVIPVVENPTKAIVKYSMPIANYEYVKLVYKAGAIPTSVEDGTVKNIDADDNDVSVSGLEEQTTYYFVIFTDKTTSDAEAFRTGAIPIPEGKWVETVSTCKATDDSFSMSFTEDMEQWKVNQSGATDEWVWLRNLGGYTLTTSSKTPSEVFANSNVLTYDTLNIGSNPIRTLQNDATWFEKRWDLDSYNYFTASQYRQSGTSGIGINANAQLQFGGGTSWSGLSVNVYGVDLLIAVNHATMESRIVWIAYFNNTGSSMNRTVQSSAQSNGYISLSKFM